MNTGNYPVVYDLTREFLDELYLRKKNDRLSFQDAPIEEIELKATLSDIWGRVEEVLATAVDNQEVLDRLAPMIPEVEDEVRARFDESRQEPLLKKIVQYRDHVIEVLTGG